MVSEGGSSRFRLDIPGTLIATDEALTGDFASSGVEEYRIAPVDSTRGATPSGVSSKVPDVDPGDIIELEWREGTVWVTSAAQLAEDLARGEPPELSDGRPLLKIDPSLGAVEGTRGTRPGLSAVRLVRVNKVIETSVRALLQAFENQLLGQIALVRLPSFAATNGEIFHPTSLERDKPILVTIHGTASSTRGSFGALHDTKAAGELAERYGRNLLCFQHRTLSESPIRNAIDLLTALPDGCQIDLLTHSRGGLIGELLVAQDQPERIDAFPADHEDDAEALRELSSLKAERGITVRRFVRVACPTRGTALMAGRLDVLLNLLLHAISLIPTLSASWLWKAFKELVRKLVHMRASPHSVPGLACMRPDGPFVEYLSDLHADARSRLAIVSGDARQPGLLGRLKTFIPDLFFRARHDLVVETDSMYGGVRRPLVHESFHRGRRGAPITHFSYFANVEVQERIAAFLAARDEALFERRRLARGDVPADTRGTMQGIWEVLGLGGNLEEPQRRGNRDVVVLVPGIMGSHLSEGPNADRVWLRVLALRRGGMARLAINNQTVKSDGPVAQAYRRITDYLNKHYDVVFADFDWRKSVTVAAKKLAALIERELDSHPHSIRILAHSMGGLVARTMIAEHQHIWQRVKARGGRLVMLGTPNGGSYVIAGLLMGDDPLFNLLVRVDATADDREDLLPIIRCYPGMLEMLPSDDRFDDPTFWVKGEVSEEFRQALLASKRLRQQLHKASDVSSDMVYVAGSAAETPNGVVGKERFERLTYTRMGDGRVTWELGRLQGVQTFFADVSHGDLADAPKIFKAIVDLLERGRTDRLQENPSLLTRAGAAREQAGDTARLTPPVAVGMDLLPDQLELIAAALGKASPLQRYEEEFALELRVKHGECIDEEQPVLMGHYDGAWLRGPEEAIDWHFRGLLRRHHALGNYPDALGDLAIISPLNRKPAEPIAIVAFGLGKPTALSAARLTRVTADAMIGFALSGEAQRILASSGRELSLAATLAGVGRGGLSIREAVVALAEAAVIANRRLRDQGMWDRVRIRRLTVYESIEDTARDVVHIFRSVRVEPPFYLEPHELIDAPWTLESPFDSDGNSQSWWMPRRPWYRTDHRRWRHVSVRSEEAAPSELRYQAHGVRALAPDTKQRINEAVLNARLDQLCRATDVDDEMVRFLFGYVVPHELRAVFREGVDILLNVDSRTAQIPWELFLVDRDDRVGAPVSQLSMVRQFSDGTTGPRIQRTSANGRALVIGDPMTPRSRFKELPAAQLEAERVAGWLRAADYDVRHVPPLASPDDIFAAIGAGPYEIVHIAGHGEYYPGSPQCSGVVLDGGQVLGANEIAASEQPPVLLFLNCCSLALMDQPQYQLAASISQRSIELGVNAVIAAGWPVVDTAASAFAEKFYAAMLGGRALAEAVSRGRVWAFRSYTAGNTWAAYQCYGDPALVLPSRAARENWITGVRAERLCDDGSGRFFFASPREAEDELRRIYMMVTRRGATELARRRLRGKLSQLDRSLIHEMRTGQVMYRMGEIWRLLGREVEADAAYVEAWQQPDCPKVLWQHPAIRRGQAAEPQDSPSLRAHALSQDEKLRRELAVMANSMVTDETWAGGVPPALDAPEVVPMTFSAGGLVGPVTGELQGGDIAPERRWLNSHINLLEERQMLGDRLAKVRLATLHVLGHHPDLAARMNKELNQGEKMHRERVSHTDLLLRPEHELLQIALGEEQHDAVIEAYGRLCDDPTGVAARDALEWLRTLYVAARDADESGPLTSLIEGELIPLLVAHVGDDEDPQKSKWGGESARNGRILKAHYQPARDHSKNTPWIEVELSVQASAGAPPLEGEVVFHVHPTFPTPTDVVLVRDGVARKVVWAWGAFTVGVEADDGWTRLELDLSDDVATRLDAGEWDEAERVHLAMWKER